MCVSYVKQLENVELTVPQFADRKVTLISWELFQEVQKKSHTYEVGAMRNTSTGKDFVCFASQFFPASIVMQMEGMVMLEWLFTPT